MYNILNDGSANSSFILYNKGQLWGIIMSTLMIKAEYKLLGMFLNERDDGIAALLLLELQHMNRVYIPRIFK